MRISFIRRSLIRKASIRRSFIRNASPFFFLVITAVLLTAASCGGNSMMTTSARQLQSITVSPASADAKTSGGMVQFMAMGTYSMAPMSATPAVRWSPGNPFSLQPVPAGVSIDMNGLAQCSGFIGTIEIDATAPMDPNMPLSRMTMSTMNVSGMAQLTCP